MFTLRMPASIIPPTITHPCLVCCALCVGLDMLELNLGSHIAHKRRCSYDNDDHGHFCPVRTHIVVRFAISNIQLRHELSIRYGPVMLEIMYVGLRHCSR